MFRNAIRFLSPLFIVGLLLIGSAGGVSAHARFIESSPVPDAVVTEAPTTIAITFGELLEREGSVIKVLASDGTQVDLGDSGLLDTNHKVLWVSLPTDLWPDTYTVSWENVSAEDGDPSSGQFAFTYTASALDAPAALASRGDQE
jgi:methionine-rich copper-binding protein CopC